MDESEKGSLEEWRGGKDRRMRPQYNNVTQSVHGSKYVCERARGTLMSMSTYEAKRKKERKAETKSKVYIAWIKRERTVNQILTVITVNHATTRMYPQNKME